MFAKLQATWMNSWYVYIKKKKEIKIKVHVNKECNTYQYQIFL